MITVQLQLVDHWTKEPVTDAEVTATLEVVPRWQGYRAPTDLDTLDCPVAFTIRGEPMILGGSVAAIGPGTFQASFDIGQDLFDGVVEERSGPLCEDTTAREKIGLQERLYPVGTVDVRVAVAGQGRQFAKSTMLSTPDDSWSEIITIDFIRRVNDLIITAVGDSIMWGEGLSDADKYVNRAARGIGELLGRRPVLAWFSARCGAVIDRAGHRRNDFIDTYPHLFNSDADRKAFREGNEAAAVKLHGEVPCSFPTIMYQLSQIDSSLGPTVDLLIINGGANDIDFEEFLASVDDDQFWMFYDPLYYEVFGRRLNDMLHEARVRCPKATIIVTGYYSAFSGRSSASKMKDFFVSQAGEGWFGRGLNAVLNPISLGHIGEDLDAAVSKVRHRSWYGHTRSLYWIMKTVAEFNASNKERKSPVIFASPRFKDENALFASEAFLHEEYQTDSLKDDASVVRRQNCVRAELLKELELFRSWMEPGASGKSFTKGSYQGLRERMDGPTSLLGILDGLIENPGNTTLWSPLYKALRGEITRIRTCLIASLIHPNGPGAAQYARRVVEQYESHRRLATRAHLEKLAGPASISSAISVRSSLRRFGLKPETGLRACLQHACIESLAVLIKTRSGDLTRFDRLFLQVAPTRKWWLNQGVGRLNANAEANFGTAIYQGDFFTLDAFGSLHLGDVSELSLQRGEVVRIGQQVVTSGPWTPEYMALLINGSEVFSASIDRPLTAGESLTLPYPAPPPPRRGATPAAPLG